MKSRLVILVFLALLSPTLRINGQACFGFGSVIPDKDSLWLPNDSIVTFTITLINKGDAPFDGDIILRASYNGSPTSYNWGVATVKGIFPNDSVVLYYTDPIPVNTIRYQGGDNTILVWPMADGAQTCDTTIAEVWVDGVISIQKPQVNTRVSLFPNPAKDVLNLVWNQDLEKLEYVRMIETTGREVFHSMVSVNEIETQNLAKGVYILEVYYSDGERGIYKISIEK